MIRSLTRTLQSTRRRTLGWTTRGALYLALGLILAHAAPMAAQEDVGQRLRAALPAEGVAEVERIVAAAIEAGIPAAPLYDKALEGAAKRVPVAMILRALESYSGRLEQSMSLLGAEAANPAIVAGADALQRGVPGEALRSIGEAAGERTPVALVVLGDLAESGIPTDGAVDVVREALSRNQEPDALLHVPAAVRRLLRDGVPPDRAVRDVARLMRDGVSPLRIRDGRRGGGGDGTGVG